MKLIFVYNADSGRLNSWLDIGHKLLSPDTYACNLCSLTHGVLSEREEWKRFREESEHELVFLHRDEFEAQYGGGQGFDYPLIVRPLEDGACECVISAEAINEVADLGELIARIKQL